MLSVVNEDGTTETGTSLIDEIVWEGARRMLAAALEAEVEQYIAELAGQRDEAGRRLVVRNGRHRPRTVTTAAGPVEVAALRVNDRRVDAERGERERFSSKILAPWCRKSPKVSEVLPLLYLHGLSSGDFVPALEQFLGGTAGLSPATVTRLTKQWTAEHAGLTLRRPRLRPRPLPQPGPRPRHRASHRPPRHPARHRTGHLPVGDRADLVRHEAPCLYPRLSREELGRRFLGRMTYLDPKGEGDNSMSENQ